VSIVVARADSPIKAKYSGPCDEFKVGQEYIFGAEKTPHMPEKFCSFAWDSLFPWVMLLRSHDARAIPLFTYHETRFKVLFPIKGVKSILEWGRYSASRVDARAFFPAFNQSGSYGSFFCQSTKFHCLPISSVYLWVSS
jgi:uncharacterized repeat protein (TIGR04076 family)